MKRNKAKLIPAARRQSLRLIAAVLLALVRALRADQAPPHFTFSLSPDDFGLYAPARVCGTNTFLMLDTASTICVLDKVFEPFLGKMLRKINAETADGSIELKLYFQPPIELGPFTSPFGGVAAILDFTRHKEVLDKNIGGLLGMSFLTNYSLAVSFDMHAAALVQGSPKSQTYSGSVALIGAGGGTISVECDLPIGQTLFTIDTGNLGTGALSAALFERLREKGCLRLEKENVTVNAAKLETVHQGRLSNLKLGGFALTNLVFMKGRGNYLGLRFLRRFNFVMDFPNSKLLLRPSDHFGIADKVDRSGLTIVRRGGRAVIFAVSKGSPAGLAGLAPGDELIEVDRFLAGSTGLHRLREEFAAPSRGGWRVKVSRGTPPHPTEIMIELEPNPSSSPLRGSKLNADEKPPLLR